jgi:predicted HAD superfamily Cof-like phosphohydrolase
MKKQLDQVKEFHNAFGVRNEEKPVIPITEVWHLRGKLLDEELEEYGEACESQDMIGIADALADQLYILLGTIQAHGLQDKMEEIFDEVHRSNMSKLGDDGKPVYRADGKVLKGLNYSPPQLAEILLDK